MTDITVIHHNNQDVVDSRILAEALGIEHRSFIRTIKKYATELQAFGGLGFEIAPLQTAGGVQNVTFCYLNEDQSTFVMTLSRNTERVVECKMKLVQAFKEARKVISQQGDRIRELELEIELRKTEQKLLDTRNTIVQTCPEPVQQKILGYQVVEVTKYRDRVILEDEIIRAGDTLTKTELCRRYGYLTRNGKPDYRRLNHALSMCQLPSEAWKLTAAIRENSELREEYLEDLDRQIIPANRQLFLGE